jgi:hypothetical protein
VRTAAQQRYYEKNKERLDRESRERKQLPEAKAERTRRDAENRNQRNSILGWRWMKWSEMFNQKLTFDYGQLSIVNAAELSNPKFVFLYRGVRREETLCNDLPTSWLQEKIPA